MISIDLYKYDGRREDVNKQLDNPRVLKGTLKDNFNYLNPTITVRLNDLIDSNYCYISTFDRYYFVEDIVIKNNGSASLFLSIDVLKTYESEIMAAQGETILKDNANPFSSTRSSSYNVQPNFKKIPFPNTDLLDKDGTIIMVTIKGNDIKQ